MKSTALVLAIICLLPAAGCGERSRDDQPDIILITLDTLRADHLGCYGNTRARTPNIDRFAGSALRYDNAFSTINTTLASHAAMMTGRHPQNLAIPRNSFPLAGDIPTLAELLSAEGYRTAAFVSCSALVSEMGLNRGFDVYDETFTLSAADQDQRRAEATTTATLEWLNQNDDGPFFLWVHYFDPHFPYDPPPPYDTMYGAEYRGPADGSMAYLEKVWAGDVTPTRADQQRLVDLYDGEIAYLDQHLGPLFDRLNRPDMEEALVAITADHGEHLTERRLKFYHGNYVYQPSIRVPLIIRFPSDRRPRGEASATVQTLDLFPTLLGVAGLTPESTTTGQDLSQPSGSTSRIAFAEASRPWSVEQQFPDQYRNVPKATMVVQYPWKLVVTPYRRQVELYNLENDPRERINLAGDEVDRARSLHRLMSDWRDKAGPRATPPDARNLERLEALGYIQ